MKNCESEESDSNTGRWNKAEHQAFLEGIKLYGKNWKIVAQHIGSRNSTQVRSHAQKYFLRESTRLSIKNQAKEFYSKIPFPDSTFDKTDKIDASTQYGEGITFPIITYLNNFTIFV